MDADEALARQLQAEEDTQAARWHQQQAQQAPGGEAQQEFQGQLQHGLQTVLRYEQPGVQEAARQAMPLVRMRATAADAAALSRQMGESPPLAEADALVQEMLAWFKTEFFTWVNTPVCHACGSQNTLSVGTEAPTPQETADGGARRTEVYRCTACMASVRFPRHNDPVKLLRTRRGRCGEWANCFCLCLRAADFAVRWVMDRADHVWCEYWSVPLGRWVHCDPCEAAWDTPLLYEAGWGKQQTYVLAISSGGVNDVTRRYTADYAATSARRTAVPEAWLESTIQSATGQLRTMMPEADRRQLEARDAAEAADLHSGRSQITFTGALPGRQTGSHEWRSQRGELGKSEVPKQPAAGRATRWRRAADGIAAWADGSEGGLGGSGRWCRVSGAAVHASGEHPPSETPVKALDSQPDTKWLDFGGGTPGQASWLEVALLSSSTPANAARLVAYALTSANDAPERDPADWVLEGLPLAAPGSDAHPNDAVGAGSSAAVGAARGGGGAASQWHVLDAREGVRFSRRGERRDFQVPEGTPACSRWRLTISRLHDPRAASAVQLACLDLYCHPPGGTAPSEQFARLQVDDSINNETLSEAVGCTQSLGSARPAPSIRMTSAPQAAAPAAAAAASAGSGSDEAEVKEAFQQHLKQHFVGLMADGNMTPAAAAAEALKLAVQH